MFTFFFLKESILLHHMIWKMYFWLFKNLGIEFLKILAFKVEIAYV